MVLDERDLSFDLEPFVNTSPNLFTELVRTNFKLKYRGSVLGFVWVLMKPFLIFLVLFLVFSGLNTGGELSSRAYAAYLLIGMILFNFFSEGIVWGMNSLMDKESIIMKVNFNRIVAVQSSVALAVINFFINSVVIMVIAVFAGIGASFVSFIYFLFVCVILMLLILSISLFTSIILVHLRDLSHIAELGLQLLFFGSAVFYPITFVPEKWRFLIVWNPLAAMIDASRSAIMFGEVTRFPYMIAIFLISIILLIAGWMFFNRSIRKIAELF
jgi:ABC-type polysaccharide/polyol phosphate export permease